MEKHRASKIAQEIKARVAKCYELSSIPRKDLDPEHTCEICITKHTNKTF